MNADTNVVSLSSAADTDADIDAMDVSDRWKKYFKAVRKLGGANMPGLKGLPPEQRAAAFREAQPPLWSSVLAFAFGAIYYIVKGMWRKGLVLLAIVIAIVMVLDIVLTVIGGETLAKAVRFVGPAIFMLMAPRDYYAFKVQGDDGWLPVRPF